MKKVLPLILLFIFTFGWSQKEAEFDVLKTVINHEISLRRTSMYLQCEQPKTFFDWQEFQEETELEVPDTLLKELETNGTKSRDGI